MDFLGRHSLDHWRSSAGQPANIRKAIDATSGSASTGVSRFAPATFSGSHSVPGPKRPFVHQPLPSATRVCHYRGEVWCSPFPRTLPVFLPPAPIRTPPLPLSAPAQFLCFLPLLAPLFGSLLDPPRPFPPFGLCLRRARSAGARRAAAVPEGPRPVGRTRKTTAARRAGRPSFLPSSSFLRDLSLQPPAAGGVLVGLLAGPSTALGAAFGWLPTTSHCPFQRAAGLTRRSLTGRSP